ncbi:unnamed protein product [Rangifer tarandus platyrhynchus]|uniref:Uncharacterized protein n=1 Tax=Rangifer tarandus platyrhynchus TaxID=3082113 RepID=A0ABN8YEG1_RANTA|nr:unnamed protein product [Rangifer tarandus platyrhynchus]
METARASQPGRRRTLGARPAAVSMETARAFRGAARERAHPERMYSGHLRALVGREPVPPAPVGTVAPGDQGVTDPPGDARVWFHLRRPLTGRDAPTFPRHLALLLTPDPFMPQPLASREVHSPASLLGCLVNKPPNLGVSVECGSLRVSLPAAGTWPSLTLVLAASAVPGRRICAGTWVLLPNPPVLSRVRNPEPRKGHVSATTQAKPQQTHKPLTAPPLHGQRALQPVCPPPPPTVITNRRHPPEAMCRAEGLDGGRPADRAAVPLERKCREGDQLQGRP